MYLSVGQREEKKGADDGEGTHTCQSRLKVVFPANASLSSADTMRRASRATLSVRRGRKASSGESRGCRLAGDPRVTAIRGARQVWKQEKHTRPRPPSF